MAKERYVMYRLSEDDYAMAERAAKELGLRTSTFARMTLLQASRKSVPAQVKPEKPVKLSSLELRLQADEGKWEARDRTRAIRQMLGWSPKLGRFTVSWFYLDAEPAYTPDDQPFRRVATDEEIAEYGLRAKAAHPSLVPMPDVPAEVTAGRMWTEEDDATYDGD